MRCSSLVMPASSPVFACVLPVIVLISVDLSDEATRNRPNQKRTDHDNAVSWIRPYGAGRVFYCSLGHNAEVFTNAAVLGTYLAGIQYALGDLKCDDSPVKK